MCVYVCVVGVEVRARVLGGVLDMEIRLNKQQLKHAPYIRGRHPAVTSAYTRQIRPAKLCVCVSARVSLCL